MYLKAEKCSFKCPLVEYLGLVLPEGCVKMDPIKIASIRDWPILKNVTQVQSFMGFVNFYHRFIPNFSHVASPLPLFDKEGGTVAMGRTQRDSLSDLEVACYIGSNPCTLQPGCMHLT